MVRWRFAGHNQLLHAGMGQSFNRMVVLSIILHLVVFTVALIWSRTPPKRLFYTPVYTVDLVPPPATPPARTKKRRGAPPKVTTKRVVKKTVKKSPPAKPVKTKKSKAIPPPKEETVSLDASITKIKERVRKRDDESFLEERIGRIKQKVEEDRMRKRRIDELRSEIRTTGGPITPSIGISSAARPSGKVTREQFDLKFKAYYQAVIERVGAFWIYTGPMREGESVIVVIRIDDSGRVAERWIEKGSKEPQLNVSALKAIDMATMDAPLPLPHEGMDREIAVRFCPAGCPE
ncbi:MAG: TonB family protein [Thermodesulfobacteriota bacterium]